MELDAALIHWYLYCLKRRGFGDYAQERHSLIFQNRALASPEGRPRSGCVVQTTGFQPSPFQSALADPEPTDFSRWSF